MKTPTIKKIFEQYQSVVSKSDTPFFILFSLAYHFLLLDTTTDNSVCIIQACGYGCWYRQSRGVTMLVPSLERERSDHMKPLGSSVIEYSFDVSSSKKKENINHLSGWVAQYQAHQMLLY